MGGRVVQAVQGERDRYRPVRSVLVMGSDPVAVARALQGETGCDAFYIADLDAIMGRAAQSEVVRALVGAIDAELWVDAAVNDVASTLSLLESGAHRAIVCSEALTDWGALQLINDAIPSERRLFSVDVVNGRVRSNASALRDLHPLSALDLLWPAGWPQCILLTLNQVGTGAGPDWDLLGAARQRFPQLSLIAGGGVRTPEDLQELASLNLDGVLIATSLHRGWITSKDLQALIMPPS